MLKLVIFRNNSMGSNHHNNHSGMDSHNIHTKILDRLSGQLLVQLLVQLRLPSFFAHKEDMGSGSNIRCNHMANIHEVGSKPLHRHQL